MAEKVAIVGSRDYPDLEAVEDFVRSLPRSTVVISGGARGVDQTAEHAARERGLRTDIFLPDYEGFGRRAPLERNTRIAHECDRLIAFWSDGSTGTADAIKKAERFGKPVEIHRPRGGSDGD